MQLQVMCARADVLCGRLEAVLVVDTRAARAKKRHLLAARQPQPTDRRIECREEKVIRVHLPCTGAPR